MLAYLGPPVQQEVEVVLLVPGVDVVLVMPAVLEEPQMGIRPYLSHSAK